MEPLVSILIPAYNSARYLSATIRSALAQTWTRTEVVIVDDGSSDGTLEIARTFSSERVLALPQANGGAARARNRAFLASRGDYIQWLDADDLLAPDKISKQMAALGQQLDPRALASGPWGHFLHRTHKARFAPSPLWTNLPPLEWLLRKMEHDVHMQPATWLVSRALTEQAGPWNEELTLDDDGEYFARVLRASNGTTFVPDAKTFYRITGGGSLSRASPSKLASQCKSSLLQVNQVLSMDDSQRARAASIKYLQKYVMTFRRRPDLLAQLDDMSSKLGGRLLEPTPPREYALIEQLFGLEAAQRTQSRYNALKWSLARMWDHTMFVLEDVLASSRSKSQRGA